MSRITLKEEVIDILSDLRIFMDGDNSHLSVQKGKLFNERCMLLFGNCDLQFLIDNLDIRRVCNYSIDNSLDSDLIRKSFRIRLAGTVFILKTKAQKLDSKSFQIDIDILTEDEIIDLDDDVNKQWARVKWITEILDRSRESIVLLDAKSGNIVYINQSALNLVNMKNEEVIGEHFSIMYDNNFQSHYKSERIELFTKGHSSYNNIKLKNHASSFQDATVRAELIQIGKYKYVHTLINENRITDDPVKESEYYHFKALFDDSLMGSALVDLNGKIFNINNSFSSFTGYSKTKIHTIELKDLSYELFDKRTADKLINSFQRSSKISNEEVLLLTKDGEWQWCRLNSSIIHDQQGKALFFILTLENIHDTKLMELKYQANRELLSALSTNLNECIYRSSLDEGIIFTNNAFVKKFGYNEFSEIENVNPAIFYADEKYRGEIIKEIELNGKILGKEVYFKRKDNSRFWGLLNCSLYIDEEGKKYLDGVITDISSQKDTEKLLKQNNKELKKINKEMDKFVYSVTHDLRAPLMSLLGLIKISKDESHEVELLKYLEMMETSVYKLDDFIKDIIDFSRNARTEVEKKPIDFEKFIYEVWHNLEYISDSEKVEFQYINELDRSYEGDQKRLSIVLSNLLSNAIRYQNYSRSNAVIRVKVEREDECLKLTVHDNGPGIPEEYQEKVFDMFFRANDTKNGSGLGLYIVKETVEKLGGVIRLKSNSIFGSSFQIFLPF